MPLSKKEDHACLPLFQILILYILQMVLHYLRDAVLEEDNSEPQEVTPNAAELEQRVEGVLNSQKWKERMESYKEANAQAAPSGRACLRARSCTRPRASRDRAASLTER